MNLLRQTDRNRLNTLISIAKHLINAGADFESHEYMKSLCTSLPVTEELLCLMIDKSAHPRVWQKRYCEDMFGSLVNRDSPVVAKRLILKGYAIESSDYQKVAEKAFYNREWVSIFKLMLERKRTATIALEKDLLLEKICSQYYPKRGGLKEIVSAMIEAEANVNAYNKLPPLYPILNNMGKEPEYKEWQEVAVLLLAHGANPRKIPSDLYQSLPIEVLYFVQEYIITDEESLSIAETLTKKIIGNMGEVLNNIIDANKLDELKQLVITTLTSTSALSPFLSLYNTGERDEIVVMRRAFVERLARQLNSLLAKKLYFNPEKGFLDIQEISERLQEEIAAWKSENKLILKMKFERKQEVATHQRLLQEQIDAQRRNAEQRERLANEVMDENRALAKAQREKLDEINKQLQQQREVTVKVSYY